MGSGEASEAAAILIQRPDNIIERFYCSLRAQEVMNTNPGHYVALVVTVAETSGAAKRLKLFRPSDYLQIGHVYRLVSFEDVLNDLNAKKLGKPLKESEGSGQRRKHKYGVDHIVVQNHEGGEGSSSIDDNHDHGSHTINGSRRRTHRRRWRPALQSIPVIYY